MKRGTAPPTDVAILVQNVDVVFRTMRVGGQRPKLSERFRFDTLMALRQVSTRVHRGEILGVIGQNGAGKSTLLRVIAGTILPTRGRVVTVGEVAPVIDLGAGFVLELTARENIVVHGTLLGRDPRELGARAERLAEWSGLGEYLDTPLRFFSAGMIARLAFGIALDCDPDIVLVDEALAVGDQVFQELSRERLADLVARGGTGVIVAHAPEWLATMCHRMLWLHNGRTVACGHPQSVAAAYRRDATDIEVAGGARRAIGAV